VNAGPAVAVNDPVGPGVSVMSSVERCVAGIAIVSFVVLILGVALLQVLD